MPYFRVDDKLHSHVKPMRAGVAALGLWVIAASWSMDQATDGWVPAYAARRLDPDAETHAADLVRAGMWHPEDRDGEPGWTFHEWDEWQHSAAYLQQRRRRNADRMRTKRANDSDEPEQPTVTRAEVGEPDPPRKTPAAPRTDADKAGDDFERFWQLYPRKTGKQAAARAFVKARRSTSVETIASGLHNAVQVWTATRTEPGFIPHPSTWLNEGRWDDERPLEAPGMPTPGQAATLGQCDGTACPGARHDWTAGRTRMVCMGDAAA